MSRLNWKWRARSFVKANGEDSSTRFTSTAAASIWCPKPLYRRKRAFFFMTSLRTAYPPFTGAAV